MSRTVVKVFCPRNHHVGNVMADTDGYAIEYYAAARHKDSVFGTKCMATDRLEGDEVAEFAGFCRSCNRPVTLDSRSLRWAALNGKREYKAPFSDTIDRIWKQAGREPMYPSHIRRLKRDPRGSDQYPNSSGNV